MWGPKVVLFATLLTFPAVAQMPAMNSMAACPPQTAPLPDALMAWGAPKTLTAATTDKRLAQAVLSLGQSADVTLAPTPHVRYPLRPEKPGGSVSHGGLLSVSIPDAGTYRVALGTGAWIDLVRDGKAIESSGHGPGPACTGLRKMVDFSLKKGSYVLQIAANGTPTIRVMIIREP